MHNLKKMNNWKLKSLNVYTLSSIIRKEKDAKYYGNVEFTNGKDEFKFTLSQEQTNEMLKLVSEAVIRSASELGKSLKGE